MRIAVLQPGYLPWLGYLEQIARVDAFVFYDDVQYDKGGWRNRNRIRTPGAEGWSWLTLPVRLPSHFPLIKEVTIDPRVPWGRKHLATIRHAYARAKYLDALDQFFGGCFEDSGERLVDVAIEGIRRLMNAFGISTRLHRSSELQVGGDRNERLLQICKTLGADRYLSGAAARSYLALELFERNGIEVDWQDFDHPSYPQCYEPFISHLSALDALLCVGPQAARLFLHNSLQADPSQLPEIHP
jgi:hypothetical protein